ncbi:MAG: DNA methyltransferase [Candidatus Aureabacteria bacterium]|nr:DNA methyltransferase [Candidatus Auribacterota bacterium]
MENTLYYGDNLDILRRDIPSESIDLIYLDPPFKSNQNYNVLFKEQDGSRAASQIQAFEDTWTWSQEDEKIFAELVTTGGKVADVMQAFRTFLGPCDMLAYLVMMCPRLIELRRALKSSGSIYLHCDPAASHYLKLLMDAVFGPENFRNEIVWRRSHPKGHAFTRLASTHDVILAFAKNAETVYWSPIYLPYDPEKSEQQYSLTDEKGRKYQLTSLLNPNPDRPNLTYEFKGITKVWRWTKERMMEADAKGLVVVPRGGKGIPRFKRYLDEQEGVPLGDWWNDIEIVSGGERLGYPTQKPVALLERIIQSSCPEGGTVLDPFCGCGTTIAAAQKLKRHWIGIDITHLAITLMKQRLKDTFGIEIISRDMKAEGVKESPGKPYFSVVGEPVSVPDAAALAESDPYQFQWWALGLVGARPAEGKKGADKGIDGKIVFQGDTVGKFETVVISVKAGNATVSHIRDLRGVVDREKAAIGVLISMEEPTKPMKTEAATAGFYESKLWNKKYPKIQLLTIEDLLTGKQVKMPPVKQVSTTFKKAERHTEKGEQLELT